MAVSNINLYKNSLPKSAKYLMKKQINSGKFIVVKRANRLRRIFLKDLTSIKIRSRKILPKVPAFDDQPGFKLVTKETQVEESDEQ